MSAFQGLDMEWCKDPDRGLPAPDLLLYFSLPVEDARKRGRYGEERYENLAFQAKVNAFLRRSFRFVALAPRSRVIIYLAFKVKEAYETRLIDFSWEVIDATKSVEELHEIIYTKSMKTVEGMTLLRPIKSLW